MTPETDNATLALRRAKRQALGLLWTIVYSAVGTLIILFICKFTTGLRVSEAEEAAGLDTSLHGEALEH